jgi:hypothetical protein
LTDKGNRLVKNPHRKSAGPVVSGLEKIFVNNLIEIEQINEDIG